ncbi:SDR family NAD(P)-dependent oxidoreductase [Vibrio sp. EA2]|uniref:SDR family NAD(P)-dependent oxidoreductase n=1 Tax=Vibrio sp. EA2 TaxID=3079860 RepID=UPI00294997E5|nr:SDR family NAD(P)-dependent oxidoreductase [Vibrio sp. EA2]MDV6253791.1 SDR family NAD(P)-dependent oxidoreductase [Vibrio sp. EA2]
MSQSQKRVLLIGASSGLGLDAAKRILKHDVIVYAAAPDIEPMRELESMGARLLEIDVTSTESVNKAIETMVEEQGGIDIVLSNAGLHVAGTVECVPEETVELLYQVNVMGAARIIRAVSPVFRTQRSGRLIFTSSIVANISMLMSGWYASTKHALKGIVTAYREEVRDMGIEVVMIEPGQVNTGFEQASIERLRKIEHFDDYQPFVEQYIGLTNEFLKKAPDSTSTALAIETAVTATSPKFIYRTTSDAKRLPWLYQLAGPKRWDNFLITEFAKHNN